MADLEYPKGITEYTDNVEATNNTVSFVRFDIFERIDAKTYKSPVGINLYMPETLENPTNVSWDGQSLGPGGSGEHGLKTGAAALWKSMQQGYQSMTAKAYGGSEASGQDLLANKEQKIVNPYTKMLFRGVNFRNFEFSFKFTPHTADESKEIWKIIQLLRATALPEEEPGGFKWKYPSEVEITYMYQGKPHPWLNRFKRCVITDCHVNYSSAGFYASMRNGFPAETQLRLQFSEIELLTRKDIQLEPGVKDAVNY